MPDPEETNPYDDPGLREAFRQGWKARVKGELRLGEALFEGGKQGGGWRVKVSPMDGKL